MGNLYFKDCYQDLEIIAYNISKSDVYKTIIEAVKKMNPNYKIYYIREWTDKEGTWYDVGSHTEFFLFKKDTFE